MQDITVASVQFQHVPGEPLKNLEIIRKFVEAAAEQQVKLICFPECCLSGYWHLRKLNREQLTELAEPVPNGPSSKILMSLAKKHDMSISAGLVELADDGRLFNTQITAMPDGQFSVHRKLHCFVSEHMESGDKYTVFTLPSGHRVGVLICYDNNIVENVRATALLGAEILLAPHQTGGCKSGSPFAMGRIDVQLWQNRSEDPDAIEREFRGDKGRGWLRRWLPARAHDNGLFLIFSNGVGQDDDEVRTGNAMILDPYGRVVEETSFPGDKMIVARLDGSLRDRSTGVRWMKSRRPELYHSLTQRGDQQATRAVRFDFETDE